jgi:hypothetical protein
MRTGRYYFETILGQVEQFTVPRGMSADAFACRLVAQTGMMWRVKL